MDLRMSHDLVTGSRILVVDDSPTNLFLARAMLEDWGAAIDEATTGAEAISLARENDYCVILMDLVLPGGNAAWAAREIRQIPGPRGCVPILALTASSVEVERDACLAAGINEVLAKPIDKSVLDHTLDRWCGALRPTGMGPGSAIDSHTFDVLRRSVTPDSFSTLINRFLAETPSRIERLRIAAREGNRDLVLREAHTLKGTAKLFGAGSLSESAADVESLASNGHDTSDKIEEAGALAAAVCECLIRVIQSGQRRG